VALLGDLNHVRAMLLPHEHSALGPDRERRLEMLQAAVTAMLEQKCGRTWGEDAEEVTVTVYGGASDQLVLPRPMRSISAITVDGVELEEGTWTPYPVSAETGHIYGVHRLDGLLWGYQWSAHYGTFAATITGHYAEGEDGEEIPADVQYAADYLIAELYKAEAATGGVIGPDGAAMELRDPWKSTIVKDVIDRYAVGRVPVF
jgi:hypothetical protein